MNYILLTFSFLFILGSCTFGNYQKRSLHQHSSLIESVGTEQYFLPELPWWSNFSGSTQCFRDKSVRYLDLPRLAQSYAFEYQQLVSWQVLFNQELSKLTKTPAGSTLLNDQNVFQQVYAQVKGGVRSLNVPAHPIVNILWVDHLLENETKLAVVKNLVAKEGFFEAVPVVISSCLSTEQLEKNWVEKKMSAEGFYFIGSEYFSPFDLKGKATPYFSLYLNSLFAEKTKLNFYSISKDIPVDFQGEWIVKKYEE